MGLFSNIKKAFSKEDDSYKVLDEKPKEKKEVPLGIRPQNTINAEHRQNIENSLVQLHRDYLARRVNINTLVDTLDDLKSKVEEDEVLAKSKRLPSTLYGIFTSTKDLKIQRVIAHIIYNLAIQGNSDGIRIAKMLDQLAGDPVTKDLMNRASKRTANL